MAKQAKTVMTQEIISIIKEVASTVTSTSNLDTIANLTLDLAMESLKATSGSVHVVDDKGDLIVIASRGINSLSEKESLSPGKDSGKRKKKLSISSPILMKDNLLGVININDKVDGNSFTENDFTLMEILANLIAVSLEQSRTASKLRSKTVELDERNRGLINNDHVRTEFIARITHELRTPMNSIKGAVYYLQDKNLSNKKHSEYMNIVSDETDKVIKLLDELLNYSSIEQREITTQKKLFNIVDIINEAVSSKIVHDSLAKKNISITISEHDPFLDVLCDKLLLLQAIINIIDGLALFTFANDSVEILIKRKKCMINLTILVKGRKIPETELPLIFDERSLWHDVSADKEKMKFYLAKKSIEMQKGGVEASNSSKGIKITVSFPTDEQEYLKAKIDQLINSYIAFVCHAMNLKKCSVMLYDKKSQYLTIRGATGVNEKIIKETRLKIGDNISGKVARENRPLLIEDIENNPSFKKQNAPQYFTKSLLSVPITVNNKAIGVLNLNNKEDGTTFNKKDFYLASMIADRLSIIIRKTKDGLKDDQFNTLSKSIDDLSAAEKQHRKKNSKITHLVFQIMQEMSMSEEDIKQALYATKLYDLGLTKIDDNIVMKSNELSDVERKIIKTHPFPGINLINEVETDDKIKNIILHHHERYDGLGYPDGLKSNRIPFISRVIAVVDSYNALVTDRPYRKALSKRDAQKEIRACSGTQFDPSVVNAFDKVV